MISDDYIVGLVEGEGCFSAAIERVNDNRPRKTSIRHKPGRKNQTLGFGLRPSFRISIIEKDRAVLEAIKEKLGVGRIYSQNVKKYNKNRQDSCQYYVQTFKDLLVVRDFFQKQTFYTTKREDFLKWAKILEIMESGRHLKKEGFMEILELREQMNVMSGKTTMRKIQEIKEKLYTKKKERQRQSSLIHNSGLNVPLLAAPLGINKP